MPLSNKRIIDSFTRGKVVFEAEEEALSDGSKVYNIVLTADPVVGIHLRLSFPDENTAQRAFFALTKVI